MSQLVFIITAVLILDGLVSAAEAAILSVSVSRVEAAKLGGKPGAENLAALKSDVQRPLGTLIVLSNIITIVGAFVVGAISAKLMGDVLTGIISAVFTFLVIVFAEIVPKMLGERYAEPASLLFAGSLVWLTRIFSPLVGFAYGIAKMFSFAPKIVSTSEEEINAIVSLGVKSGSIGSNEANLIKRIFLLNDITASDLMTPRKKVFHLEGAKKLGEIKDKILAAKNSRIPVTTGASVDNVVGIVHQRDLLIALQEGKSETELFVLAKKPLFVPAAMKADALLHEFQRTRMHLAVVVSEHGETMGVVTLEDCLEELVGEIIDEKDVMPELIKRISKDEILAHGDTKGRYVNSLFQSSLPETKTLNGFLQSLSHRVPDKGETVLWKDMKFLVEEISGGEIQRVRIFRQTEPLGK
jgi:CBS domain containing-hemolysin-like protein